jgi:hypothetical protein
MKHEHHGSLQTLRGRDRRGVRTLSTWGQGSAVNADRGGGASSTSVTARVDELIKQPSLPGWQRPSKSAQCVLLENGHSHLTDHLLP